MMRNLLLLPSFSKTSGGLHMIIEGTRGTRAKCKYNPEYGTFDLSYVLPEGAVFPFDFGFVPSTVAPDGDPLDIIAISGSPTPVGCLVEVRVVGVIEAEQTQGEKTFRNDRLVSVAIASGQHDGIRDLANLSSTLLDQFENFFVSYNRMRNREFKPKRRSDHETAMKLIDRAVQAFKAPSSEI